jgi:stalled ribosome rescue protein Dom34
MSTKTKKQFGIWMDSHQAIVVGRKQPDIGEFVVLAHENNVGQGNNSSENAGNNAERTLQSKFFKRIASHLQNVEELHVTGTGQVQEQFIHYITETAQFKNIVASQSTSNKMADEKVLEFIAEKFI